ARATWRRAGRPRVPHGRPARAATTGWARRARRASAGFRRWWSQRAACGAILASAGRPAIEPIVAREQPFAADGGERERAQKRARSAQLIDYPVAAGGAVGTRRAPAPAALLTGPGPRRAAPAGRP